MAAGTPTLSCLQKDTAGASEGVRQAGKDLILAQASLPSGKAKGLKFYITLCSNSNTSYYWYSYDHFYLSFTLPKPEE